ncbi:MAG: prolyl oligopeptidase family serine peptidase [Burkholderiales bacterium]|nr:prolyl oligopeptidase family serine peptidase [Burkholderiales bacterium]
MVLSIACASPSAHAIALLSDELKLHLPWRAKSQQPAHSFPSNLKGINNLIFQVAEVKEPGSADEDFEIPWQLINYQGELYGASLKHRENNSLEITSATKMQMPKGRGNLVFLEQINTKTADQIETEYSLAIREGLKLRYDVSVYRVLYQTIDTFGNLTTASGVIAVPIGISSGAPVLSFQHGAISNRANAPSINGKKIGTDIVLYLMGAKGYLTVVPDYSGFDNSSGLHPFLHAKSLAWSVVDLIRCVRSLAVANHYALNDQLFLIGYSEGGYATMAAQREIEMHHADEFTITASAPMAGPYDLLGTMLQQILSDAPFSKPVYFLYWLLAYNQIYGFKENISDLLAENFDTTVLELFDGEHDSNTINAALPVIPSKLFASNLLTALKNDDYHPIKVAMKNNDAYRWTPTSPTRLYHCLFDKGSITFNCWRYRKKPDST